jgi:hypothetical protein
MYGYSSNFVYTLHIFEFFQVFSCFNPNFYGISNKNFQNLLQNLVKMHILIMQSVELSYFELADELPVNNFYINVINTTNN